MNKKIILMCIIMGFTALCHADEMHLSQEAFLQKTFGNSPAVSKTLWLTAPIKNTAEKIMQHRINMLRVRYWENQQKTAWILDEIGKEKPITIGIVIHQNSIESVEILKFRESRGWEIRHSFFTKQFQGIAIDNNQRLNKPIDGISGATLSVSAVKRCAALALYLSQQINIST